MSKNWRFWDTLQTKKNTIMEILLEHLKNSDIMAVAFCFCVMCVVMSAIYINKHKDDER